MCDVVALGELLIDFLPYGKSGQGNDLFEACPGGAPCNVLAMLAKLDKRTAFIGKLGKDMFGLKLKSLIEQVGIDSCGIVFDEKVNTTLAFVSTNDAGERNFSFYRNLGADMMLAKDEINGALIKSSKIFHFGTLSMTHTSVRETTHTAVDIAKKSGALISFDPNLRPLLWDNLAEAKEQMAWGCEQCDILKIADDEAEFLTGEKFAPSAAAVIRKRYPGIRLILVTRGRDGSLAYYGNICVCQSAFTSTKTIDTTGAGDTFFGCCLDAVLREGIGNFTEKKLNETLRFANAAAAIVTTRKGALLSMPDEIEIRQLLG